jgi:hypothetical protein
MKAARFLFAMLFLAISMPGVGLGYLFAQSTQQASSQSDEKAASSAVADEQKNMQSTDRKNQNGENTDGKPTNSEKASKTIIKRSSVVSPAKQAPSYRQVRSANATTETLRSSAPETAPHFSQTAASSADSGKTDTVSTKHLSTRNNPAPVSSFAVSGQQFKNSRDPGARLAVNGGPANSTRGTAAINGSNIKRKP